MPRAKTPDEVRGRQMQREFVSTLRRYRASYEEAIYWFRKARAEVGLDRPPN